MDITVEDPENPEGGRHRILTSLGFVRSYGVMNGAAGEGREVLFTVGGPDAAEAARRISDLLNLDEPPPREAMDGFSALRERVAQEARELRGST